MNTSYKLITVAAMLLHSIFGCSLHHACACESHAHGEPPQAAEVAQADSCEHDHDSHHGETSCGHDHDEECDDTASSQGLISNGCDCCENTPGEHDDSPCCSEVQCSFILANDNDFSLDVGPVLFVLVNDDFSRIESTSLSSRADGGRLRSGCDDSLSRCALHCSWQI